MFVLLIHRGPPMASKSRVVHQEMNLMQLVEQFDSDAKCRACLEALRWPDGPECPRCQSTSILRVADDRGVLDCRGCGYQFTVTSGTILHDTHLPLRKWFIATYLICESKKGISANQMKRTLSVSYKTAWYLCHRIRAAMKDANPSPLFGIIEIDETWVGGEVRGKGRGYTGNKTMVVGAVQRGGEIRLRVEKRNDKKTLHGFIHEVTHDGAEAIFTDEHPAYRGIGDANTRHEMVHHKAEEWVRAEVHTNSVEGVWSLFKRSIVGSYHQLSSKHMNAYLDEMAFRFNNRENPYLFRDTLLKLLSADNLPYAVLVRD
jgi:transposase-like protein